MKSLETLNKEQRLIFDKLTQGANLFITGEAGTGKSYLINTFSEWCYENHIKLMKLAPTGVAANNIGGATIHSQFELETNVLMRSDFLVPKAVTESDVILIDEIGMVRLDVFDCVCGKLQTANSLRAGDKKKPIQLILVGDFTQLPPVITNQDKKLLNEVYQIDVEKGFAFQSQFWHDLGIETVTLHEIIRQSEKDFCEALNKARFGDPSCLTYIKANCSKTLIPDAIFIVGKNRSAAKINEAKLREIEGTEYTSNIIKEGKITSSDYPCDDILKFKVGAKVMLLINNNVEGYSNGDMGIIEQYFEKDKRVKIKLETGETIMVGKETFNNYKYELKQKKDGKDSTIEKEIIGSATQFPFKLAYAITVHKSQGQTFEAINFIPELFDDGQFYVAISRCKTVGKIYIHGNIPAMQVKAAREVIEFYKDPEHYSFFNKKFVSVQMPKVKYEALIKHLLEDENLYNSALVAVDRKIKLKQIKNSLF